MCVSNVYLDTQICAHLMYIYLSVCMYYCVTLHISVCLYMSIQKYMLHVCGLYVSGYMVLECMSVCKYTVWGQVERK